MFFGCMRHVNALSLHYANIQRLFQYCAKVCVILLFLHKLRQNVTEYINIWHYLCNVKNVDNN